MRRPIGAAVLLRLARVFTSDNPVEAERLLDRGLEVMTQLLEPDRRAIRPQAPCLTACVAPDRAFALRRAFDVTDAPDKDIQRLLLTFQRSFDYSYAMAKGSPPGKTDVLQGTLDLMILSALEGMGPLHGYGIARRIEQISDATLRLNEGTVYTSLMRLQHRGWISATWGTSENNRKARFYAITASGRRQLSAETKNWERIAGVITRLLGTVRQP